MLGGAVLALAAALAPGPANALWPAPQELATGHDVLYIDDRVRITYNGQAVRRPPLPPRRLMLSWPCRPEC